MDGPPRHGTESVPSRLLLCGCWSLFWRLNPQYMKITPGA